MRTPAVLACMLPMVALCQTAASPPSFEVASIKPDTSSDPASGDFVNGRLILRNQNLRSLIGAAYHVPNDSIFGPDWLYDVRFDVAAKTDAGVSEDQSRIMLQALLAERLKLKAHIEKKVLEVYALTVAKGGLKLAVSKPDSPGAADCPSYRPLICHKVRVGRLTSMLPQIARLDMPVKDLTGLTELYDIHLSLEPPPGFPRPTVFEVEEQLGLQLAAGKYPIDAVIIDHIERVPVEN